MSDLRKAPIENEVDIQEQHTETAQETHKGFLVWVKVHKTQLMIEMAKEDENDSDEDLTDAELA